MNRDAVVEHSFAVFRNGEASVLRFVSGKVANAEGTGGIECVIPRVPVGRLTRIGGRVHERDAEHLSLALDG